MRDRWLRFYIMSPQDKILVLRAAALLVFYAASLRLLGLKRTLALSGPLSVDTAPPADGSNNTFPARAVSAVKRAGRSLSIGTCLSRSLAIRKLLNSAGIDAVVRLGTRSGGNGFEAHAWVEYGGGTLDAEPDGTSYSAFPARF